MNKPAFTLRPFVHIGALVPLVIIAARFFTNTLSVNPIQTLEQKTGVTALIFLTLSLACSPLGAILDWRDLAKRKKALGLYGFMYAAIHFLLFIGLDYGFDFKRIVTDVLGKPFIWIGLTAFTLLLALAATSFKKMKSLLKKNWKRLHRLIYLIVPLVVTHFFLALKGNILQLQGNILEPLIYGLVVLLLLVLRVPAIKAIFIKTRVSVQNRFRRTNPV